MPSNFWRKGLVAGFAAMSLAGCGLKVGENAAKAPSIQISTDGYGCVSHIADRVQDYVMDKMDAGQVRSFVGCLQKSFTSFAEYTRGKNENSYSPDEIRDFLQKYFIKDKTISDELLHQMMLVKQSVVGGSDTEVRRQDLAALVDVLGRVETEAVRLKPYISVLNPVLIRFQDPNAVGPKLADAQKALNLAIDDLSGVLAGSAHPYSFENLQKLIEQFREFSDWNRHFDNVRPASAWVDLLRSFKVISVSQDPQVIHGKDWQPLLTDISKWYVDFLKFRVGVQNQPVLQGPGFNNLVYLADEVLSHIQDAVKRHPQRMIPYNELDHLIFAMKNLDWLPERVSAESVSGILRPILNKVFSPTDVPSDKRQSPGLTLVNVTRMASEFYQWSEVQMALQEKYEHQGEWGRLRVYGMSFPVLNPPQGSAQIPSEGLLPIGKDSYWDQFISSFSKQRPLFREDRDRVFLIEQSLLPTYQVHNGFFNLSVMNILKSAVGLVLKGYSTVGDTHGLNWESGLKDDDLQSFYEDFRSFGIELGIIDPRQHSSGHRSYMEGNLFTYAADGLKPDGLLNYQEGMEFFAFLYSGGELSDDLYKDLAQVCPTGPLDVMGRPKIGRSCVRERLLDSLIHNVSNMPQLRDFLTHLSPEQRSTYTDTLINTAYAKYSKPDWMEKMELSTLATVVHYSEAVMTRYNADDNNILDAKEIETAFPVFEGLVQKIYLISKTADGTAAKDVPPLSDGLANSAFKFIVYHRRLPELSWPKGTGWFQRQLPTPDEREIEYHNFVDWGEGLQLDRMQLAQVFESIIEKMSAVSQVASQKKSQEQKSNQPVPSKTLIGH